jgi:hypothetical protein
MKRSARKPVSARSSRNGYAPWHDTLDRFVDFAVAKALSFF